jgi:DNA-directed RNA polymerase specialized sigma24 family protein
MFGFFTKKAEKRDVDELKTAVQTGFNKVKQDMDSYSQWIKHLDKHNSDVKHEVLELKEELASAKDELDNIKNMLAIVGKGSFRQQASTLFNKQTADVDVLNTVQSTVQTVFLDNLTTNERAIVFVLMNSDLKLSYEDLAAMLGKRKSTIRGQVNSIKQKSEGLIEEIIGENNKKRVFIPEQTRDLLLKTNKVRNKGKR